ncbi:hypothetical protein MMC25_002215 [Agyrium rufum]|nr:hypothetical protein [Agyrium rufum]
MNDNLHERTKELERRIVQMERVIGTSYGETGETTSTIGNALLTPATSSTRSCIADESNTQKTDVAAEVDNVAHSSEIQLLDNGFSATIKVSTGPSTATTTTVTHGKVIVEQKARDPYPLTVALRNIWFHPLSKFPGPKLWAASRLPYVISLLRGNLVQEHDSFHKRYAPNDMPQNIFTTTDAVVYARMRKLLQHSFNDKSLQSQEPSIESYADLIITRFRDLAKASTTDEKSAIVDMTDWVNFFTIDIIGDLAFGESFGCLQESAYHPWVKTLSNFLKGMVYVAATRFYPALHDVLMRMISKSVLEVQKNHTKFAVERIYRRLNKETDRPDFLTPFIKNNSNFENMSLGEIESTFAVLIVAGSEVTSTTLCGILNLLTQNPDAMQKLVSEIRSAFMIEKDITIESTKRLAYLEAVINESSRLCNPVPWGLPRIVPAGGDTYCEHWLPGNTQVSIRPYTISHMDTYFNEPQSFKPERWLPESQRPAQFQNDHLSASNPFSVGPTWCLGKGLAWAEMRIFLCRLLWAFDVEEIPERGCFGVD